jgi:hypothetical protein
VRRSTGRSSGDPGSRLDDAAKEAGSLAPPPEETEAVDSSVVDSLKTHTRRFVKPEVPYSVRMMQVLNFLILVAFANRITRALFEVAIVFIFAVVITSEARSAADSFWFSVLVIALVIGVWIAAVVLSGRVTNLLLRLVNGPPAFGDLGGSPKHLVRAAIRTSKELRFELAPGDAAVLDAHMALLLKADETYLRAKFVELLESEGRSLEPDQLEAEWKEVWEAEILEYRVRDATLRDTYASPSYSGPIIPLRLLQVGELTGPIFLAFNAALVLLSYRALTGTGSFLTVLQVGLAFSFLITTIIYLNHLKSLAFLQVLEPAEELIDELPEELREQIRDNVGRQIVPIRVSATPSYFSAVRDYFARSIATVMTYNAIVGVVMISIPLLAGVIVASDSRSQLASMYAKLAVAIAVIPLAIVALHYLTSLLIQHVRRYAAIAVGGLAAALLPVGLQYLANGDIATSTQAVVTAAVVGVVGSVATAFGTHLTEHIGPSSRTPQPA